MSFCSNFGRKGKTQPYYWLATDHNNKDKKKITEMEKEKLKENTNIERL
jgi:hypothetical protein